MMRNVVLFFVVFIGSFHTHAFGQMSQQKSEIEIARLCNWNANTAVHIRELQVVGISQDVAKSRLVLKLNSIDLPSDMSAVREKMIKDTSKAVDLIYGFPDFFEDLDDTMLYNEIYHICDKENRK